MAVFDDFTVDLEPRPSIRAASFAGAGDQIGLLGDLRGQHAVFGTVNGDFGHLLPAPRFLRASNSA